APQSSRTLPKSPSPSASATSSVANRACAFAAHSLALFVPLSFVTAQLGEPFFENGLLPSRDVREHDAHSHVGEDKYHFAVCCECRFCVRDSDRNLCAFWRRI